MAFNSAEKVANRVDEVRALGAERLEKRDAKAFHEVLDIFVATAAREEILEQSAEELYGSFLALWKFCQTRPPEKSKVRIYNPRIAEHGWESSHTIVEAVNDDMPFLVDSLTVLLTEKGLGLHALVHPVLHVRRDAKGALAGITKAGDKNATSESVIQVKIDQVADPKTLAELGFTEDQIPMLAQIAFDDPQTIGNPRDLTIESYQQIYQRTFDLGRR